MVKLMIEYDSIVLFYICMIVIVESIFFVCWRGNGGVVYLLVLDCFFCIVL